MAALRAGRQDEADALRQARLAAMGEKPADNEDEAPEPVDLTKNEDPDEVDEVAEPSTVGERS